MPKTIYPRCSGDTCIRCRRKFERGDRVQIVNIIEKVGSHPVNPLEMGAWFAGEFEIQHALCADPGLDGTIIFGAAV